MRNAMRCGPRMILFAMTAALLPLVAPSKWAAAEPTAQPPLAIFHHVHLTSADPPAAIQWYLGNLGGRLTKVGPFDAVLYGTTNVLFTKHAAGFPGSEGSSVDHVGFSYPDIAAKMKELAAAGVEIVSGVEQEGPIKFAFVKDPWGTLIEIVEDPQIVGFHHIHLATTDPAETLGWYANAFGGQVTRFAGLIPGIRYGDAWVLAKKVAETRAPTKGRAIDHVSWGFADLDAAAVVLKGKGVKFVSGPLAFGGGKIAFIEAPDGVRIELVGPGKPSAGKPAAASEPGGQARWRSLFDGRSLDGWTQRGGAANYRVDGDQIVGTSVPKTSNSFLCTNQEFADFILELEFKVDPKLNSGIQIRSECFDEPKQVGRDGKTREIPAGRVHGYQVEIDPSDRAWTAGIYDEGRRGWLNDLKGNEPARQAFKGGEWNQLRVECRGDSIKTWLNGVPAADLHDGMTPRGFIALQVHGVGDNTDPREVRWRKLRIQEIH